MATQNNATQNNASQLKFAAKRARDHAETVLGQPLQYRLEWSERLVKSAGVAVIPVDGRAKVRLSAPIFRQAAVDLGIAGACDEVRNTVLREIAGLVTDDGRGPWWRCTMLLLGVDPNGNRRYRLRRSE